MTEYINDINRENTEVLAEYGADEKVRQAYTYGESGIGERVSVDKSEESSYYLYDGRNSVTGILTETANLTNSYQYDPYGNLTSGTADGVNYYGYNGESTNVKTGLQYLRARYYDAENGTFTTEDSDLGTTENPLTRNRYDYTTNNPLNYSDPTGNSLWSRIKGAAKKAVKKVVKTVVNTAKKVVKTVAKGVKAAAKWVKNAVSHPKQVIQKAKNTVKQKAKQASQKIVSSGSNFIRAVSKGGVKGGLSYIGNGAKKVYSSFKSYASEKTKEIRQTIKRELCTTTNRISSAFGKVDWNVVKKVVAGGAILAGLGIATIVTGGAAAGGIAAAIASGAFSGALIGGGTGAVLGGLASAANGDGFIQGAADGFLWGTIGGAVSGGVGAATGSLASSSASSALKNPLTKNVIENAADTAVDTADDLAHGRDVSAKSIAMDFGKGVLSGELNRYSSDLGISKKTPVEPYEVTTLNDARKRSVVGDELEAHEVWQHANLKKNGLASERLSSEVSKENPVIMLPKEIHSKVNKMQRKLDVSKSPVDNINENIDILNQIDEIPKSKITEIGNNALQHQKNVMKK